MQRSEGGWQAAVLLQPRHAITPVTSDKASAAEAWSFSMEAADATQIEVLASVGPEPSRHLGASQREIEKYRCFIPQFPCPAVPPTTFSMAETEMVSQTQANKMTSPAFMAPPLNKLTIKSSLRVKTKPSPREGAFELSLWGRRICKEEHFQLREGHGQSL